MKTAVDLKKQKRAAEAVFLSLFETVFYKGILCNV